MSVKKIHLFPSEESYVANSGSVEADDLALVPLNLSFKDLSDKPEVYVTEVWEDKTLWYRRWSDGRLEQGGRITLEVWTGGHSPNRTFTLPLAFSNATYTTVVTGEGGYGWTTLKVVSQTNGSITVTGTGASTDDRVSFVHFYCSGH